MRFPKAANKQKNGVSMTYPDVCKVPAPPAPFVPTPFPNIVAASSQLKSAAKKVKSMQKEIQKVQSKSSKSQGDEAGSLKGVMESVKKMSILFDQHSVKVKAEGKKASILTAPDRAQKVYANAVKQQKAFEKKLEVECKKLTKACKADRDQMKVANRIIALVTRAARGHRI